jgi:hypothetical protein
VHAINPTDQATLKEAWANADVTDASTVTTEAFPLTFLGGLAMNIPPGQTQTVTAGGVSCASTAQADVRILSLLSETHSSTTRSSTTIVRASGPAERVYENYSWSDPFRVRFDTVTANPAPNGASRTSGGASGVLLVHPGDQLAWECEILNDTPGSITYANRLFGSEVCNVRGYVADASGPLRCISN